LSTKAIFEAIKAMNRGLICDKVKVSNLGSGGM
jgi:hypothetical protein